jgi:competence protein ComEC
VIVDRSSSDAVRLTLDRVVLFDVAPYKTPRRVRVSLHGNWGDPSPQVHEVVQMTAHISPPNGPAEPGGFDFRRHAWFQKIGAVGYTRTPVVLWQERPVGVSLASLRSDLSARVQARLPGQVGAFAAAVMTGDRAGMGQGMLDSLRASNLAHLLAISGLHMGLLAGVVFGAVRVALVLIPFLGLRLPVRKIAAVVALFAAAGYLLLSGGNVATERAFVMVAVMLMAVLFDRRALSLRAVAVAAVIVLLLHPQALVGPGFQMSFAATTALVAVFGLLRDRRIGLGPRWLRPVLALLISSVVAGAATAPFGAAHFNQLSQYGLLANLLSVPLMGTVVIPAAVVAACLIPLGLETPALWILGLGLRWILAVSEWVAGIDGATRMVIAPDWQVLPLLSLGALWLILWQGHGRWFGLLPCLIALILWVKTDRPALLISNQGGLVGMMTLDGRAINRAKGQGFVAQVWLENDGTTRTQSEAAALWPKNASFQGQTLNILRGKAATAAPTCNPTDWLISDRDLPAGLPCRVTDAATLRKSGAVAVMPDGRLRTVRDETACRLWSPCDPDQ